MYLFIKEDNDGGKVVKRINKSVDKNMTFEKY